MKRLSVEKQNCDCIQEALNEVLNIPVKKVIFSTKTTKKWPHDYTHQKYRIMTMLKGSFIYDIGLKNKVKSVILTPGTVLVAPPGNLAIWPNNLTSHPQELSDDSCMLTLVFWDQYLRFLLTNTSPPGRMKHFWYHSNSVLRGTTFIVRALNELMSHKSDSIELKMLISALFHTCREELQQKAPSESGKAERTYHAIKNHMREHLHLPINRASVAEDFKLTPSHISKLFAQFDVSTFNTCLRNLRLETAVEMLRSLDFTIDEIAEYCGYKDTGYFIKSFRKVYGVTPGEFKKKQL